MTKQDSNDDYLFSITKGASLHFVGKIILNIFGFLLHFVLTRGLGAGLYGIYAYCKTILTLSQVFTNLGSSTSLLRYLPRYQKDPESQNFILGMATFTSFIGSFLMLLVLVFGAPYISDVTLDDSKFVSALRIFSLILIFSTLTKVITSTFRSLEELKYEILVNKIAGPLIRILAVISVLVFGLSLIGVTLGLLVASFVILSFSVYLLIRNFDIRPSLKINEINSEEVYEYYNYSIPLTFIHVGDVLLNRVDILMIGFFFSSTIVGVYNIAVLVAGILSLPLSAFNQLFPPISSRLHEKGDSDKVNSLYKTLTRWIFTISLILSIELIAFRNELLNIFGEGFSEGTLVLVLFVVGQMFNSAGGANGYLLMMTDHQYVMLVNQWIFGILNIILNYIFIMEYGFIGAALATVTILAAINITKTIELWYLENLFPYSKTYLKPIFAGVVTIGSLYVIHIPISGVNRLIIGGIIGFVIYLLVLISLGTELEDRELISEILDEQG